ncbi:MAG TPA: tetratricopeptide repeat protein [Longimicrobiales bacterium]|nr:tetratricopeptide repeat protein [Longimicrobiales bacterium]
MSGSSIPRLRPRGAGAWRLFAPLTAALLVIGGNGAAAAQSLAADLRRARTPLSACREAGGTEAPPRASAADRSAAADLLARADEAALLGDADEATALLRQAADLDPGSAEVAYRLARGFEDARDAEAAVAEYCRFLALESTGSRAEDVIERLGELTESSPIEADARAQAAFADGLARAEANDLVGAEAAFTAVVAVAPRWPDPWYNRALVRAEQGDASGARSDLGYYLDLRPGASDAGVVEARIAAAAPPAMAPLPGRLPQATPFVANALVPGLGQFRTRRWLVGTAALGAAAGLVTLGVSSERTVVRCIVVPEAGQCPAGQVAGTEIERPYLAAGLGAAAIVSLLGALEQQRWYAAEVARTERVGAASGARVEVGPAMRGGGEGIDVSLVRLRF